jgi:hypothetical protein
MRILDVDLDFFLDNIATDRSSGGERLSESDYHPWNKRAVRKFLQHQCGLTRRHRIPGKYAIHHDEAFYWWRDLIRSGQLATPFEIVHVDAHADLGSDMLGSSSAYIGYYLLHRPVEERENPEKYDRKMNAGNYLLVTIACRWVSKLTYVRHPKNSLEDCEDWLFSDHGDKSWTISLPKCKKPEFPLPGLRPKVLERDPEIEFVPVPSSDFQDSGQFDYMLLCHSPGFTPASSDRLIPVIQDYMDLTT